MGRGGPWWSVGLVGGAGASIAFAASGGTGAEAAPRRTRAAQPPRWVGCGLLGTLRCAGGARGRCVIARWSEGAAEFVYGAACVVCRVVGLVLGVPLLVYVFRNFPWRFAGFPSVFI